MSTATITSKGRITIPADIRNSLGLKAGVRVVFTQLDEGTTIMRAKTRSILELKGSLKPRDTHRVVSIEDMSIARS